LKPIWTVNYKPQPDGLIKNSCNFHRSKCVYFANGHNGGLNCLRLPHRKLSKYSRVLFTFAQLSQKRENIPSDLRFQIHKTFLEPGCQSQQKNKEGSLKTISLTQRLNSKDFREGQIFFAVWSNDHLILFFSTFLKVWGESHIFRLLVNF